MPIRVRRLRIRTGGIRVGGLRVGGLRVGGLRVRRGGKRRLSTRILVSQLLILAVTGAIGFVLLAFAQRAQLDRAYEKRALAIAQTTAAEPQIQQAMEYGGGGDTVQTVAERIRKASQASYVVVIDLHGVRHSHPHPELIGKHVAEPLVVLDGGTQVGIDQGVTGRSANGKAALYGPSGSLVGEVSVGIRERDVLRELWRELPTFGLYAGIATAVGSAAAYLLARRLKRSTFGLELEEI
ncbi:MAG: two-component system, CitB family, sensor kinase, partial [Streptomyces sp.]|nr:two-component system, CitB family, sensor kinase [Streptomyces sp.]